MVSTLEKTLISMGYETWCSLPPGSGDIRGMVAVGDRLFVRTDTSIFDCSEKGKAVFVGLVADFPELAN